MLIGLKEILNIAEEGNFAIPAFNVYNMETVMGVIEACEELNSPVILQSYSRLFTNKEAYYVAPIILAAAKKASVPVCFHLDHGAGEREVTRALDYGATGVMIDASTLPLEENIAVTKSIVEKAGYLNVAVEGELGHIGSTKDEVMSDFTDVDEAVEFCKKTGVAALAIMVGTAHGHYKKSPVLDIKRREDIHSKTKTALVLHGGSGVPDDQIQAAVKAGIRKINFGTDVCCSFINEVYAVPKDIIAVDMFMKKPIEAVKNFAMSKIRLLGAENKA